MGFQIQQVDTRDAPEALLREMHHYYLGMKAEDLPDDPPTPFEAQAADWKHLPDVYSVPRWLLRERGEIVAVGVAFMDLEQNLENGAGRVHVKPEHRGRGLARMVGEPVLMTLADNGRIRLDTHVIADSVSEGFPEKLGLQKVYGDKRSRLVLADLDHQLMRSWIDRAEERASEYELLYMEAPYPDEVLQKYCDLFLIMNTAPREAFEAEDEVLTPEVWRDTEAKELAGGNALHLCVAVHKPSGDFAGYTVIKTQGLEPDQAWQWDTGVDPAHRNKGLGRWLKAAMIDKLAADYPEVDRIDTYNAGSNEPMLNINIAMGFKPILLTNAWQGDLAKARELLGG